jgi:hypothetical protein
MKKRKLIICIFLLNTYYINSQNQDYLITKKNDTLFGKVIRCNYDNCKLKVGKKKIKYNSEEIIEFKRKGYNYEFVESPFSWDYGERIYLHRVLSGKINLYSKVIDTQHGIVAYCLSKNGSELVEVFTNDVFSNKTRHRETRKYIKDNVSLTKEFDEMKGKIKNIKYILNKYNGN